MTMAAQLSMNSAAKALGDLPRRLPVEGELPSFGGAVGWLNSKPLTASSLHGKVVLAYFWTYTCINWRRTLPYVRAWSAKYKDAGLVVIGVHTPEFSFEKNVANIRWAIKDMKIEYPVAIDSNYAVWNAFNNQYWPALYFVDAKGRIRHHQFGEGDYAQSEAVLQQLLKEAGATALDLSPASVEPSGAEVAADWNNLRSQENYVGYERTEGFAAPDGATRNKPRVYTVPTQLGLNQWSLAGDWTIGKEAVTSNQVHGRIAYCFHARDLNLIMGPSSHGSSVRFRVSVDGQQPGNAHGVDADEQGNGVATEQRMYQLIRQHGPIVDRKFGIEFLDSEIEAFDFTFG